MTDPHDIQQGSRALGRARAFLDRHAKTISRLNEQLSAVAVALAIIVSLTAAVRAPGYWADRSAPPTVQQN
jgi:hypothetical protein